MALSRDQLPDTAGRELEIPVVILTTAGQELFHFTQGAVNMKYLQRFSKFLKSKSSNLAYVGKVEPSTGGSADSATVTLIEPEIRIACGTYTMTPKRLIEVAFPLKQVSLDSVHEKNVRHGHISTLHIWPARRPLAASRAALIATLLPDPGNAEKRKELLERMAGRVVEKIERKRLNGRVVEKVKEVTEGGILHWGPRERPRPPVVPR